MAQRLALVIGNDDYLDSTLARLTAPQADIAAFAELLQDPQRGAFDEVQILHNRMQADVRREIARFFHDRQRDDLLLLYFSGHGVLDEEGQLYLATPDTERDLLDATAITAYYVNRLMRRCRSRRQVLILDCCHSGAFDRSAKGGGVGTEVGIGEAFAGDGTGHIVLAASKATEYAFEGDELLGEARTSVFTRALTDGIRTGDADLDEDGYITPEELYEYAFRRVREVSPRQTPGKWVYEQTGEMILARSPRRRLPDEIQGRLSATDPLIRFRAVDDLVALMRTDDETLAALARRALEELSLSDDSFTVKRAAAFALGATSPPQPPAPVETATSADAASDAVRSAEALREVAFAATHTHEPISAQIDDVKVAVGTPGAETALPQPTEPSPLAITWDDYGPVAAAWILAIGIPLGVTYQVESIELFFLAVLLAVALTSGFTFQRLLSWARRPEPASGVPILAGLLGVVPLGGPPGYTALLLQRISPWKQLRAKQRLGAAAYALLTLGSQALCTPLSYVFWEFEEWVYFKADHIWLLIFFLAHGTALFIGGSLLIRSIIVNQQSLTSDVVS